MITLTAKDICQGYNAGVLNHLPIAEKIAIISLRIDMQDMVVESVETNTMSNETKEKLTALIEKAQKRVNESIHVKVLDMFEVMG